MPPPALDWLIFNSYLDMAFFLPPSTNLPAAEKPEPNRQFSPFPQKHPLSLLLSFSCLAPCCLRCIALFGRSCHVGFPFAPRSLVCDIRFLGTRGTTRFFILASRFSPPEFQPGFFFRNGLNIFLRPLAPSLRCCPPFSVGWANLFDTEAVSRLPQHY